MPRKDETVEISLRRSSFGEKEREAVRYGGLTAGQFRYDTGIEAIRLSNARGSVVVLPYMGQIVWSANFDGVELAMQSMFREPRPAKVIVETYGCLAYHAGLLRNGVPSPEDTHILHGEMPCAEMDEAGIACGADARGPWIAVTGRREYAMGFGAHYLATPRVVVRPGESGCEIVMEVANLSAAPMDLMYMCHVNFAFAEGARIVQPVPFTSEHVITRTAIPGHVTPNPDYRALLDALAADPARMRTLSEPERYDPEQVFYIKGAEAGRRRARPFPDGAPRGRRLRHRLGPRHHAAHDPLDPRQQRSARRRLRDARDVRTRGLSRREAQGQRALARRERAGFVRNPNRLYRTGSCGRRSRRDRGLPAMTTNKTPRIAVIGSNMVDLVTYVNRMPVRGETVEAPSFEMGHGGKGANQAVAAAKLGAAVVMVTKVGDDMFADNTIRNLASFGVDTKHVRRVPGRSSGVAPIMVEPSGENSILIVKGANADLSPNDIERAAEDLKTCDLILLQLEIPLETVYAAIAFGKQHGVKTLLNPAPATPELDPDKIRDASFWFPTRRNSRS